MIPGDAPTEAPRRTRPADGVRSRVAPARWPDLDALPGVAEAVAGAREAIAGVRRLPENRRNWPKTAAAAAIRGARASAMLDGGSGAVAVRGGRSASTDTAAGGPEGGAGGAAGGPGRDPEAEAGGAGESSDGGTVVTDPILAGALRVSAAIGELSAVWQRAPLQALARLHTLAAADLTGADQLGRPRPDRAVAQRLAGLADVVTAAPWSGPTLYSVVHGELLALRPFAEANGVVARGAARLALVTSGLDPQALTAPEVGFLAMRGEYAQFAAGFASGDPDAVAQWIVAGCAALRAGAKEARSIAIAAKGGTTPALKDARKHGRDLV